MGKSVSMVRAKSLRTSESCRSAIVMAGHPPGRRAEPVPGSGGKQAARVTLGTAPMGTHTVEGFVSRIHRIDLRSAHTHGEVTSLGVPGPRGPDHDVVPEGG